MSDDRPESYALIVGIDRYINNLELPNLEGCANDANAVEQILRDRFGVPQENIHKLINSEATHQAIVDAFKKQLIEKAQDWDARGRPGAPPMFVFHYSGHGSQAIDTTGTEPDGMDETICPHDSRTAGVYDIKDWELGQLLDELTKYSDNVTVSLDCCHSGSGTREIKPAVVRRRRAPADLRPQPTQRPPAARTRGVVGPSNWLPGGSYVLLAGCRDREESNEYIVRDGGGQQRQGAMTYFLVKELAQMRADRPLTYRELHERVSFQVNTEYRDQMPQCEGDLGREVFGGVRPQQDTFFSVVEKSEGMLWLDGGVAHGLTEGSLLKAYPPETRTLADAGQPIATLEVAQPGAIRSGCIVQDGAPEVPLHARAVIHQINYGDMRRRVVLDVADPPLLDALKTRLAKDDVATYIEAVAADSAPDFRVELADGKLEIQDSTGKPLVAPFSTTDSEALGRDLAHLARYRNALGLSNTAPSSELAGAISLAIKMLSFDSITQQPIAVDLPTGAGGEIVIEEGDKVVFQITNNSDLPLHVALLQFGADWEVAPLVPILPGAHETIRPHTTFSRGLSRKLTEQLRAAVPEGMPESRDIFKVIATVQDTSFETLKQGPLKTPFQKRTASAQRTTVSALDRLLNQAMSGGRTRAFGPPPSAVQDEWTTAQIEVLTVRPAARESKQLVGRTATVLPGYQIEIEPPAGFTGSARVLTRTQSTRAAGGDLADQQPPPGLAAFGAMFQPLDLRGTRSAGPTGAVIEIDADASSRRQVTPSTPLKLRLPGGAGDDSAGLLVLAYDGSFYYPVGRMSGQDTSIAVEWLPDPAPDTEAPLHSRRGLGRTVKLYAYKLLKLPDPSLGLHHARFVPGEQAAADPAEGDEQAWPIQGGEVRYRDLRPGELQAGQKVALFVHGFTSDTRWMVSGPAQLIAAHGLRYDHILTFDYETFNTGVSDNGQALANALRAAGLGPDDGLSLDVFAHSMGTLVSRCMVELWGGDEFVDRLFMAGPPNQGTRLADGKGLITWLGTLLLNQAGPTPPTLLASWVWKRVSDDAVGVENLRPGSEIIAQLNSSSKPARVGYYVMAGRNEIPTEARGAWQRLCQQAQLGADVLLDFVFGDQNDTVIGVKSMLGVRNGTYPKKLLKTKVLKCNHGGYFDAADGRAQLIEWLGGQ
ncbi:MAG: caspase family protein [Kouleothrix sp.]|nr:caspase family protein [Kouleothrix sp.]